MVQLEVSLKTGGEADTRREEKERERDVSLLCTPVNSRRVVCSSQRRSRERSRSTTVLSRREAFFPFG